MDTNQRKVKKISLTRLRNIALWYLEQFGGTRARVQKVLEKRIAQAEREYGKEREAAKWMQEILDELESLGYINDSAFAQARVKRGLRQGKSAKHIEHDLMKSGVSEHIRQETMRELQDGRENPDLEAARAYVRRHNLGSYRTDPKPYQNKDLAKLARRGFSYQIARQALYQR